MLRKFLCTLLALLMILSCFAFNVSAEESTNMKTSQEGINYIKSVEGFSKYPYYDYGQYTVGYGTRCPADKYQEYKTNGISDAAAEELLKQFLKYTEDEINQKIINKYNLTLTQGQFDALVSLSFNIGTSWMTSSKNGILRNAIINPQSTSNDIVYAFALYCNAGGKVLPGLVKRRLTEANMFVNSEYSASNTFGFVYYDANGGEVDYRVHGFDATFDNSTIPACSDNKEFMGWYTQPVGGDKINKIDASLNQKTLFAHWSNQNTSETKVKVTHNEVNIRSGPGTNYDKIGTINKDTIITISHVTHITNTMWGKFKNGWISLSYTNYEKVINGDETVSGDVSTENNDQEAVLFTGKVNVNDSLRVRSGPGTDYSITGYLKHNDTVNIYQTQNVIDVTWGRIGNSKWISLDYVIIDKEENSSPENNGSEVEESQTPSTDSTGEMSTESTEGTESTESTTPVTPETPTIPNETEEPNDTNNESTIDTPNQEDSSFESKNEQSTQPASTPEENKSTESVVENIKTIIKGKVKVSDSLRIRNGAGLNNKTVGYLTNGQIITIYEQKEASNMTWGRIGDNRWVSLTYVTTYTEQVVEKENSNQEIINGIINVQNNLRVRSAPGTTNQIVGYLGPKQKVTITETTMVGNVKWGKIGDDRWISMEYVIVQDDANQTQNNTQFTIIKTITADCLRIRSNAGTENKIVGYLYQGTKVTVLETKTAKDGTLWGRTKNGWISMSYTK